MTRKKPSISASPTQKLTFTLEAASSGYFDPMFGSFPPKTYRCRPSINPGATCYILHCGPFGRYKVLEAEMSGYYFNGAFWQLRLRFPGMCRKDIFVYMDAVGKTVFLTSRAAISKAERKNRLRKVKVEYLPR